jgi:hypothetical protein
MSRAGALAEETAALLAGVRGLLARFVRASDAALDIAAAWVLHTHAIAAADATPYLHVTGPTKRCGKTRFLEALRLVSARPFPAANATPAAIFRALDSEPPPTLFLDECDAIFKRGKDAANGAEDLRALLNAGNRRGTPAIRCVGNGADLRVKAFNVFGPKCLAGIGDLPSTLADRSLRIRLDRLAPGEQVERLLESKPPEQAEHLRRSLEAWAEAAVERLEALDPEPPAELDDRAADACLALFAIADLAGGDWPERIRAACVALRCGDDSEPDPGTRLLDALARIFAERGYPAALATAEIVAALADDPDAPGGYDPEDARRSGRRLAAALRRYGVRRRDIRIEGRIVKGYSWETLAPVIARYGTLKGDIGDNPHGYAENEATQKATTGARVAYPDCAETRMVEPLSPMSPIEGEEEAMERLPLGAEQAVRTLLALGQAPEAVAEFTGLPVALVMRLAEPEPEEPVLW